MTCRILVPDDRRAAQRRRAAAAQGRHQRARRHHADPRQLGRPVRRMATEPHFIGGVVCYGDQPRRVDHSGCRACRCRSPIRCCRSATSINAIAAYYLFGEGGELTRWLGIGFIVVGVWLVARPGSLAVSAHAEHDAATQAAYLKFAGPDARRGDDRRRRRGAALGPDHQRALGAGASRRRCRNVLRRPPGARADLGDRRRSKSRCSSAASAPATR